MASSLVPRRFNRCHMTVVGRAIHVHSFFTVYMMSGRSAARSLARATMALYQEASSVILNQFTFGVLLPWDFDLIRTLEIQL